jgi:DNA-binding beta-propeller fold protein YncE/tRNA A-37 threonylcarbamoyl transferase component Bud32
MPGPPSHLIAPPTRVALKEVDVSLSIDPRIGSELLGYRIEALIGQGGMSVVYLAEDLRLKRRVALKLLAPALAEDEAFRTRFLKESQLAASLDHPNVVPIYAAGEAGDELYIAMRYVEGQDLKALLRGGPLEPERAIRLCAQVADALDFAHGRGLVHRDVKPSNVLLDAKEHAYLADFGLTKRVGEGRTVEPGLFGTIDYVAPEQIRGEEVDGRADVYALGCLLYECLAGEAPFRRGSDAATLYAHLEEPAPTLPGLDAVLQKALAKDPEERYQTCGELIDAARNALGIAAPSRSRWPLAFAAVGLALIAAALLAFFLTRGGSSGPAAQGGRLLRIDPATNRVESSVAVGDGATAVAVGSGRVWVAAYRDATLWQVDPRTGSAKKIPAFGRPYAVTIHSGGAYVAALGPGKFAGNVSTFDAVTGGRVGGIGKFACSLAAGEYGVWAAGCPDVQQLSSEGATQNPRIRATVVIPFPRPLTAGNYREALAAMAVGEGAVWVTGDAADRRLWRIDPAQHRIAATIHLDFPPGGIAAGGGAVWVSDQLGDRVVRIDPATNRVDKSIPVGRGAGGVTFGSGSVWVTGAIAHTVTRIDPATARIVATIPVAASPQAVAAGEGALWVVGDAR